MPQPGREELPAAFDHWLKPGAAALAGANLVPGWLELMPRQRIYSDLSKVAEDPESHDVIEQGGEIFSKVADAAGSPLTTWGRELYTEQFADKTAAYLVHECLATAWQPVWRADLADRFAQIDATHIGAAALRILRDTHLFTAAQRQTLADATSVGIKLTRQGIFTPSVRTGRYFSVAGPGLAH